MKYTEWELLNEAIGGATNLGLSNPQTVGGPVGAFNFKEGPLADDEDEDEDDDDFDDDEEDEDGVDLLGKKPEGPKKGFPPDDSESMDGLPAPDEEMLDAPEGEGDEMDATLADIDPDLAGLGDDDMGGPVDPAMGGEMGDDELPPEIADMMGDEMGGEMGDEMGDDMGDDMGGPMGDEMGPEMGDEMGMDDEMGGMGDEMGMDTAADLPCPDCNPDGEMEEGEPECEMCGGEGFVTDDQAEMPEEPGSIDADMAMGDDMGGDDLGAEAGPAGEMMDLMSRMNAYCAKYMPAMMQAQMSSQMSDQMASHQRKHMSKIASNNSQAGKYKALPQSGEVRRPNHPIKVKAKSFMDKDADCCDEKGCCKEDTDFLASILDAAKGTAHQKWSSGIKEDALIPAAEPQQQQEEPQAGDAGFAPQGRVGGIGGGYQMSDFEEIPTLESKSYSSFGDYLKRKSK